MSLKTSFLNNKIRNYDISYCCVYYYIIYFYHHHQPHLWTDLQSSIEAVNSLVIISRQIEQHTQACLIWGWRHHGEIVVYNDNDDNSSRTAIIYFQYISITSLQTTMNPHHYPFKSHQKGLHKTPQYSNQLHNSSKQTYSNENTFRSLFYFYIIKWRYKCKDVTDSSLTPPIKPHNYTSPHKPI